MTSKSGERMGSYQPRADGRERARVGLCIVCRQARRIRSDRGSVFYFCERSQTDPKFQKYPRLPVISCPGFEPVEDTPPPRLD